MRFAAIVVAALSARCAGDELPKPTDRERSVGGLPPGAVKVGSDLYQVPVGADGSGPMFRLYSPGGMVSQVITCRAAGGEPPE